jgi:hypothetical protein
MSGTKHRIHIVWNTNVRLVMTMTSVWDIFKRLRLRVLMSQRVKGSRLNVADVIDVSGPLSTFTGCEESIQQIRSQVSRCDQHHVRCDHSNSLTRPRELPTRLPRIGGDGNTKTLELANSSDMKPDTRYTTLSYRRGKDVSCTLRQDDIEVFRKSVSISKLSQTFQDAAVVTLGLGLRHIWIDALCIIQGPTTDWLREGSKIGSVYTGSELTISELTTH